MDRRQFMKGAVAVPIAVAAGIGAATEVAQMGIWGIDLASGPDRTIACVTWPSRCFTWVAEMTEDGRWRVLDTGEIISDVDAYMADMMGALRGKPA